MNLKIGILGGHTGWNNLLQQIGGHYGFIASG